VKKPSWIPRSGSWKVVPAPGNGNGGVGIGSWFGTPGRGIGIGIAPGLWFGTVKTRPGTEIRPIELDVDRDSLPVDPSATTVATVRTFDRVP
jgi:hypothetical protein